MKIISIYSNVMYNKRFFYTVVFTLKWHQRTLHVI